MSSNKKLGKGLSSLLGNKAILESENKTNKVYLIDPDTFGFWINGQKESDIK